MEIPILPKEDIPSENKIFLEHIIKIIEETTISYKGRSIAFGLMIDAAKSVIDLFIEFEKNYRYDPLETDTLKKFDYYMNGYADAMENIGEIIDFIKTYVSPEDYKPYLKLYVKGLNMMVTSLTEIDFPVIINIIRDLDTIIKEEDPEIAWQAIRDYVRQMT